MTPLAWLRANGWTVHRTACWVYVEKWRRHQLLDARRFTSVIRAARILQAEAAALARRAA